MPSISMANSRDSQDMFHKDVSAAMQHRGKELGQPAPNPWSHRRRLRRLLPRRKRAQP